MGILLGAGQYFLTAITVVCIAILIFVLRNLTGKKARIKERRVVKKN